MIEISPHAEGAVLPVLAQPGARRNAVLGERAGALRVAVSSAPEKGKASAAILAVVAGWLGLPASRLRLLSGQTSRRKRFLVVDATADELKARLATILHEPAEEHPFR